MTTRTAHRNSDRGLLLQKRGCNGPHRPWQHPSWGAEKSLLQEFGSAASSLWTHICAGTPPHSRFPPAPRFRSSHLITPAPCLQDTLSRTASHSPLSFLLSMLNIPSPSSLQMGHYLQTLLTTVIVAQTSISFLDLRSRKKEGNKKS